ncbi:MAG: CPBP family intramembrane metalloprotease [Planctomycetota bacterium]|nr:CPBP family intramembrane metalloprotease [Planctomycetota bacterium]
MPAWFDHLFAALILGVMPLYSAIEGKQYLDSLERTGRVRGYLTTMAFQWTQTLVLLGAWLWFARDWSSLGLGFQAGVGFWVVLALVVVLVAQQLWQLRRAHHDGAFRERVRPQVEPVRAMVPTDRRERRWFDALSWTAGVCEEIVYRGFVIWYLGTWMPTWAALLVGSIAFGLLHMYEGPKAAGQIVGIALVFGGLYLASGSLWIPMVAHAVLDMLQVRSAMALLGPGPGANAMGAGELEGASPAEGSAGPLQLSGQPDA